MKGNRTQQIKAAFLRLRETDPADRARLLVTEHGADPELHRAVHALLTKAEHVPDGFLEPLPEVVEAAERARTRSGQQVDGQQPAADGSFADADEAGRPGQRIGPYELVRPLGEGGFGVVWEAEQKEPIHRLVALKLIKRGMDSKQVIARFAAEQQALAVMDHPSIAKVLDAGSTADGRPYFAMELVIGTPIVLYCQQRNLATEARLRIFEVVCRAIHHAHQRGIVHRDIKPSNVLVMECDGDAIPKVIDFGIAKAVGAANGSSSQLTHQRQLVGTPAYMAPEQTESTGAEVDARSDVYSLGVVLYELLTEVTPFHEDVTTSVGFETLARRIRDEQPSRPSRRAGALPSDLDWIALKCLEKEKSRRYGSAQELADDVRRHLDDLPVVAGPPDLVYRLRKFCRRHRVVVGSAMALAAVLFVVATVGLFWTGWKNRQLDASNAELRQKNEAYLREKSIAQRALQDVERLSDAHVLANLVRRAERDLWPAVIEKADLMEQWLTEAQQVVDRTDLHRAELMAVRARALPPGQVGFESEQVLPGAVRFSLRPRHDPTVPASDSSIGLSTEPAMAGPDGPEARTWSFASTKDAWLHGLLSDFVQRLDAFAAPASGTMASVRERLAFARMAAARIVGDDAEAWRQAIDDIVQGDRYPELRATGFRPQFGLVPLGRDPGSGLQEFLDLATHDGPIPARDADGSLPLAAESGVVLVLIPGGSFRMGAQREDESAPNFDILARADEGPVHEVTVAPFFLAKHELTQAQWMRLDGGSNPSYFYFGLVVNEIRVTKRHPVEQVEWSEGRRVLHQAGLQYPTEEQWEYATRAGTDTLWSYGNEGPQLHRFANFADRSSKDVLVQVTNFDDGHMFTAPVGSFAANPFGLHDVHGNVCEWCSDLFRPSYRESGPIPQPLTADGPRDPRQRAVRGGAWASSPNRLRSAFREFVRGNAISAGIGVRPAREIQRR
jgi:formylglycine-generating enzyme required for sulfatase activity